MSGFAVRRGTAGLAPTPSPLRLPQAETGGGGSTPHPHPPSGDATGPGPPESPPEGLGDRLSTSEPHCGAHRGGHHRHPFSSCEQRPTAATKLWDSAVAARPAPSAPRPLDRVTTGGQQGACAARSRQRRQPGGVGASGARQQESVSPGFAGILLETDSPT